MKYYWKLISDDGLLKEPILREGYNRGTKLNDYGGFSSKEEAIAELYSARADGSFKYDELLLVELY